MKEDGETELPIKDWSELGMCTSAVDEIADERYPKTFVWAFKNDSTVSPDKQGQKLAISLQRKGVPVICDLYPGTLHGVGLGEHTVAKGWLQRAISFWLDIKEE